MKRNKHHSCVDVCMGSRNTARKVKCFLSIIDVKPSRQGL
uniref:Uncharacterized protein n=1 Tax=Arundo donax TaxID=35708 RepID=A0A0A9H9M1_ARUDO